MMAYIPVRSLNMSYPDEWTTILDTQTLERFHLKADGFYSLAKT